MRAAESFRENFAAFSLQFRQLACYYFFAKENNQRL